MNTADPTQNPPYPVVEFERSHRFTGLSHQYKYPTNLNDSAFEKAQLKRFIDLTAPSGSDLDDLTKLNNKICNLNPELEDIRRGKKDFEKEKAFLQGVISRFNPLDIEEFLDSYVTHDMNKIVNANSLFEERVDYLRDRLGMLGDNIWIPAGWVFSHETLENIDRQIDTRLSLAPPAIADGRQKLSGEKRNDGPSAPRGPKV